MWRFRREWHRREEDQVYDLKQSSRHWEMTMPFKRLTTDLGYMWWAVGMRRYFSLSMWMIYS